MKVLIGLQVITRHADGIQKVHPEPRTVFVVVVSHLRKIAERLIGTNTKQKVLATKEKMDEFHLIKIGNFCSLKKKVK